VSKNTALQISDIKVVQNIRTPSKDPELTGLMTSIEQNGLLAPIGIKFDAAEEPIVIWGHRRFEALKRLGYKTLHLNKEYVVPEREMTEEDFILTNAIENIHRKDINPIELGKVAEYLHENHNLSYADIAARMAVSYGRITSAVTVFRGAPKEFRDQVGFMQGSGNKMGRIPSGTMAWVASFIPEKDRVSVLNEIRKENIPMTQLAVLRGLLSSGLTLKDALAELKNWRVTYVPFLVNPFVAEKLFGPRWKHKVSGKIRDSAILGEKLPKGLLHAQSAELIEA